MLRQVTAIFLLLAFSVLVFNQVIIVADYYANASSYAKVCENKFQPAKHCNGRCQMTKKLKAEEKKEQQNPGLNAPNKNEVPSSKSFFPTLVVQEATVSEIPATFNNTSYPKGIYPLIFHPPAS